MNKETISRRSFLKGLGKGAGVASLLTVIPFDFLSAKDRVNKELLDHDEEKWGACTVNCSSLCGIKTFIKEGKIAWVETDHTTTDEWGTHQVRACVRGRSTRYRVYNPLRLKYPMKRVGKRGEGKFKRISWDEAYTMIADKMKDIKKRYGNEAFYIAYGSGSLKGVLSKSWPPGTSVFARLMNLYGGYLNYYNSYSVAQIESALDAFYGSSWAAGSALATIKDSDLVVNFGFNVATMRMSGGGNNYEFMQALERNKGVPYIYIDPILSDTAINHSAQWVPIRPATDAALVAGIAHEMISHNWHNQAFLDKYCIGFDRHTLPADAPKNGSYKDYVMGSGPDGIEKTPKWASEITGIPVEQIKKLAMRIGKAKRPFIMQGFGPQRQSNGEQECRAIATLSCMKGMGIAGTSSGSTVGDVANIPIKSFPVGKNPVSTMISMFTWTDAITRSQEMTDITDGLRGAKKLKAPIKFIWCYAGNMINQHCDFNKTAKILEDESKCEFIVDINIVMSTSAKYADILLPESSHFEKLDISNYGGEKGIRPYVVVSGQAIKPTFETEPAYDMALGVAKKLGLEDKFSEGRTHDEWVKYLWAESRKQAPDLPPFDQMLKQGIYKRPPVPEKEWPVAYKDYVENPIKNKLATPSGKIEIYSYKIAEVMKTWKLRPGQELSAIPIHMDSRETYRDTTRKDFPLQCFGHHHKGRTHSSYWENAQSRKVNPQYLWINPIDAKPRGVEHGKKAQVFNKRGIVEIVANVTNRIRPGVVSFPEGGWYKNKNGVDVGGCINTLASMEPNPYSKGNGTHSILVEVKKV